MKAFVISALFAAMALGAWSGWRSGAQENRRRLPPGLPAPGSGKDHPPKKSTVQVAGSSSVQDWKDLISGDSDEAETDSLAWGAKLRETARGLSMRDLREQIEDGLSDPALEQTVLGTLGTLMRELSSRDPAQACELMHRKKAWRYDGSVFQEWGKRNPQAALAWLDAHSEHRAYGRQEVINGWAEKDPAAAFEAVRAWPAEQDGNVLNIFVPWARTDPEAAVAAWAAHPDRGFFQGARWEEAIRGATPAQRVRLLSAFREIPNPGAKAAGLTAFAEFLAAQGQTEEAIHMTEEASIPGPAAAVMRQRVLAQWAQSGDGSAAAEWFWTSAPPDNRGDTLKTLLSIWNSSGDHHEESVRWMRTQTAGSMPPEAPQLLLEAVFRQSPVSALKGWLALQSGEGVSQDAILRLNNHLSSAPDSLRLSGLLQDAGFPPNLQHQILKAAGQEHELEN